VTKDESHDPLSFIGNEEFDARITPSGRTLLDEIRKWANGKPFRLISAIHDLKLSPRICGNDLDEILIIEGWDVRWVFTGSGWERFARAP
jgi:hypothetical protein